MIYFPRESYVCFCVHMCMCMCCVCICLHVRVYACMFGGGDEYAHICMAWKEGLRAGCLLSHPTFSHFWMTLNGLLPLRLSPAPSANMDQPPSRTVLKVPLLPLVPYCLLSSKHEQKVLKVVGFEHHPISPILLRGQWKDIL